MRAWSMRLMTLSESCWSRTTLARVNVELTRKIVPSARNARVQASTCRLTSPMITTISETAKATAACTAKAVVVLGAGEFVMPTTLPGRAARRVSTATQPCVRKYFAPSAAIRPNANRLTGLSSFTGSANFGLASIAIVQRKRVPLPSGSRT